MGTENTDNGKYNSVEVAKYIVAYWNDKGAEINMTKLQKLLYIAYGSWLAVKNERLTDEHPQAWPYGPVFPTTRNYFLKINFDNITFDNVPDELKKDNELENIISEIYNSQFGSWLSNKLSAWSHLKGSPWDKANNKKGFKWGDRIEDKDIKKYFREVVLYNE